MTMKKFIITLVTTLLIFLAPTVLADNFEVGAKHAIAVDAATEKSCMKKMLISQLKLLLLLNY